MVLTVETLKIEEIVTDVVAMDLIHSSADFFAMLVGRADLPLGMMLVGIRRSAKDSTGETDIELVVKGPHHPRVGLLIENKIGAPLQPDQFFRYRQRGDAGIQAGKWSRYLVVLMAPGHYYDSLPIEQKNHVDVFLPYEDIIDFLGSRPEFAFKQHVFESALSDARKGYVKHPDSTMMTFYQNYWELASREFPQLRMPKPSLVGRDGTWIYFPHLYEGVRLIHKFKEIGCEVEIKSRNGEALAEALSALVPSDVVVRVKRSAVYLNVMTPAINHAGEFSEIRGAVVECLATLSRLREFAMNGAVRHVIVATR